MKSRSKNVYIDKLADTANKYNHTCHSTIKVKPVDVKQNSSIDFSKENNKINPKFKLVTCNENRNIKIFLQKATFRRYFCC